LQITFSATETSEEYDSDADALSEEVVMDVRFVAVRAFL